VSRVLPWKPPPHPLLFEINTWPWLAGLGGGADLGTVTDRQWDEVAASGCDAVWLMGVWRRSPTGIALALADPAIAAGVDAALPDRRPDDVVGSPYCVRDYVVDERLGGPAGLERARAALAERGIGLVLDFVPNHVAPDHPWVRDHPERFVTGTREDLARDPRSFVDVEGHVLANGRDPFFPAWPDVVQLNAFAVELRTAAIDTLRTIGDQCDGVRCDMAMLMMNDVFERTWGERAGPRPTEEFWPAVLGAVRATHPDLLFVAEAYWDLEWALQQQGFDHCYDKRLYDRLLHEGAEAVRLHLCADDDFQAGLLRFVENHDEPRVASLIDPDRQKAMTVATLTQTGARLVHHGQAEGRKVRLPVFLGRFPDEPVDADLAAFHRSLLRVLRDPTFRHGRWRLCERSGSEQLVTWCWDGETRWLVVVNLGAATAVGQVRTPWDDLRGRPVRLVDDTNGVAYEREGVDLVDGLYVELGAWAWHLFRVEAP
jgi:glycosidase